jgi:hypothetical protein
MSDSTAASAREDAIKNAAAAADSAAADGITRMRVYKKRKKSNVWTTRSLNFRSQQVNKVLLILITLLHVALVPVICVRCL